MAEEYQEENEGLRYVRWILSTSYDWTTYPWFNPPKVYWVIREGHNILTMGVYIDYPEDDEAQQELHKKTIREVLEYLPGIVSIMEPVTLNPIYKNKPSKN